MTGRIGKSTCYANVRKLSLDLQCLHKEPNVPVMSIFFGGEVRQTDAKSLLASWPCGKNFCFSERPYLKAIGRKQENDT